jgi:hypothetical protein
MKVELEEMQGRLGCVVTLDTCQVNFRRRDEAHAFVARLQERLSAPHALPGDCCGLSSETAGRRFPS